MTCEIFSTNKDNPEGSPNLFIYKTETGEEVFSIIQKKQLEWEPYWAGDEEMVGFLSGGEVLFYEVHSETAFIKPARVLGGGRNGKFSISPSANKAFVAHYVPGAKGAPSMCKLYQYPNINQNQALAVKSLFQADKFDMLWNKRGTDLLLLTSTEVDKSNASYYGKQALHYMSTKGESYAVSLNKEGPIHAVEWSPKSTEFCVIYGYMPSKSALFNLKCDPVFEFGAGSRNSIYYNPFGNILLLAGFGNLRGNVEVWDVAKRTQITGFQASDSTMLEWSPSGDIFVTATTAPRLRMGNGFKVWHYSGALLHETVWPTGQELFEVNFQKYANETFKEPPITNQKIEGIKSNQPQASTVAYRPPNLRDGAPATTKTLHDGEDEDKPRVPGQYLGTTAQSKSRGGGAGGGGAQYPRKSDTGGSRGARNKRYDARKKGGDTSQEGSSSQNESADSTLLSNTSSEGGNNRWPSTSKPRGSRGSQGGGTPRGPIGTGDPEKDKRIKTINKKLQDISKLKSKKEKGEHLEHNQLAKITSEPELVAELKKLTV